MYAGGDCGDCKEPTHLNWPIALSGRAIAELSIRVPSPRPHRPIGPQCNGVITATCNRDDIRNTADLYRGHTPSGRPIAQLPKFVVTPRPHRTVSLERHRVVSARGDRSNIRQAAHLPGYHVRLCRAIT